MFLLSFLHFMHSSENIYHSKKGLDLTIVLGLPHFPILDVTFQALASNSIHLSLTLVNLFLLLKGIDPNDNMWIKPKNTTFRISNKSLSMHL